MEEPSLPSLDGLRRAARRRLGDLIGEERRRASFHIQLIRQAEPRASNDRVADVLTERWAKAAAVEGGVTGAVGLFGIPLNLMLFTYGQIALIVSVAEAYGIALEGEPGEDAVLEVLGRANGFDAVVRTGPRVLAAIARALAFKHGLGLFGRAVPLVAAPISARLNARDMERAGAESMRRFGNVYRLS